MDKEQLQEHLGMGISRRTMLKRMGYGLTGAALAPSFIETVLGGQKTGAPTSTSDTTPTPVWQFSTPNLTLSCSLFNGTVITSAVDSAQNGILYSLDTQTANVRWSYSYGQSVEPKRPLQIGSVIYVSDGAGNLYAHDSLTGTLLPGWPKSLGVANDLTFAAGNLIFPTADGKIRAVDMEGNLVWDFTGRSGGTTSKSVVLGSVVLTILNNELYALKIDTGEILWSFADPSIELVSELTIGNGIAYVLAQVTTLNQKEYVLFALAAGGSQGGSCSPATVCAQIQWHASLGNPVPTATRAFSDPVYYNGAVYLGDYRGRFYSFDASSGSAQWFTDVTASLSGADPGIFPDAGTTIFIEDGTAYVTAIMLDGSGATLYAIDLTTQGQEIVSFSSPENDWLGVAGIETGVCYYYNLFSPNTIASIDLSGLLHQFFAESELMVEDYDTSGDTPQAQTTSFRSHVQLLDENRNPRSFKSVKIWASEAATLNSGGQSYSIGPTSTVWLQTDSAGELSLVVNADSLTAPALYLWGNFMDVGEAIVLYPDHDALHRLSNVQAEPQADPNVPSLQYATAYDGTPLLPSGFTGVDDLAQVIRNTIGVPQASLARTQFTQTQTGSKQKKPRKKPKKHHGTPPPTQTATSYIAYPGSNTNMVYQPIASSTLRTYVPNTSVPSWTACFDPVTGSVIFDNGACTPFAGSPLPGSVFSSIDDFVNNVVKGARKIAHITWTAIENGLQTIIDDANNTYNLTISALEHAAHIVEGIIKTVVGDIKKAVQWLSFLFDWSDILRTKENIKSAIGTKATALENWIEGQIANDLTAVTAFFNNVVSSIDGGFFNSSQVTQISGNTLQSQQQNGNNPQAAFGAGGAKSYTKSRWLTSKFKENAPHASITSSPSVGLGSFDPNTIVTSVELLFTSIPKAISSDFSSVPSDITNLISNLGKLVTDPTALTSHSFGDFLTLLKSIAKGFVLLAEYVIEDILIACGKVLEAVLDPQNGLINQQINIPIISDLYEQFAGSPLTFLDLCCLMVAIPATIVAKAIGSATTGVVGAVDPQKLDLTFALFVFAILDPLIDIGLQQLSAVKEFLEGVAVACSAIIILLGIPDDLDADQSAAASMFYFATSLPVSVGAMDIALSKLSSASPLIMLKNTWELGKNFYNCFYGACMFLFAIVLAVQDSSFGGLTLATNLLTPLPDCFKWLGAGESVTPTPSKLALGAIDGVCDLTVAGISVAAWA